MPHPHSPTDTHPEHQRLVEEYEKQGYHHVHVRHDNAGMIYSPHYHPDQVVLHVVEGELDVELDGRHELLSAGKKISIAAERFHTTCVGTEGCTYIHAEKHVTA